MYYLIRKRIFSKRFPNITWLEKEYIFWDFEIYWLEKYNFPEISKKVCIEKDYVLKRFSIYLD